MEAHLKARSRTVPKSVGRTVGVLPVESRNARNPAPPRPRLPSSSRRGTGSAKKVAPSSASSISSYRTLASSCSSARSCSGTRVSDLNADDLIDPSDQDVAFTEAPNNCKSGARPTASAASERGHREKKTFSPAEILESCQEKDYYKVYEIDLHGADLTHIPDLEKFRKLRVADLSGNHIRKIQHLDFTQDLRDLKLYDNELTALDGLTSLKELVNLQVQHNKIKALGKSLTSLKKLKWLRLDSNELTTLETSQLVSCVQLTTLDLSNNRLTNLSALSYLPNLEELLAAGNCLQKLADLHRCKKLQEVDLSRNLLSDLSGISGLPALQILDISHNKLKSVSSLGKLKSLEDLNLSSNQVHELKGWDVSFPKLQVLNLTDNVISSWKQMEYLHGLSELVELSLGGNPVTLEGGECPAYHTAIQTVLSALEIVDGAHVKRAGSKTGTGVPLMRPMSASSVISIRQVDGQIKAATLHQQNLQKEITDRFSSLKSMFDELPASAPPRSLSAREGSSSASDASPQPPSSRCSRRSRIRDAQAYASTLIPDT